MKMISEITMIDCANMALASGRDAFIVINPDATMAVESTNDRNKLQFPRPHVAKVTEHKQFRITDPEYSFDVEPAKIYDIHMRRHIMPWPQSYKPQ